MRLTRRQLLGGAAASLAAAPTLADDVIRLPLPGGPPERAITSGFPQKRGMILQRTRPPLLETPFEVFDRGLFTPNDQFFVRWHWSAIPTDIDVMAFRLVVRGHVARPLALTLDELAELPRVELAAVNQCSGNSRGLVQPAVPGAQWAHGAMGNARWTGVRLKDVLERAGIRAGALQVRFNGLDEALVPEAPDYIKSLDLDHARDGEVMIAYAMNGAPLPLLNGFPLRLVVPGWYSTYWVKMLSDIEVLARPDDSYWMATAYRIPDTPGASVKPGETGFRTVPISRMPPRSFVTNLQAGARVRTDVPFLVRGIAFGGDSGVAKVDLSSDGGRRWQPTQLGADAGKYSFRSWQTTVAIADMGAHTLMVRCTNAAGEVQPSVPAWNAGGFMLNVIESTPIVAA